MTWNETDAPESATSDADRGDADGAGPDEQPSGENLAVVQFKGHRKGYYHNRRGIDLRRGDYCLVEADRGRDLGRVTYLGPGHRRWWREAGRQGVLKRAAAEDLARLHENRGDEWQFWDVCRERIASHGLDMSLVTVERQFDHNKITFYFTAEKRVDFRDLVRDLASHFRTRIELRQIGARDEARLKGGLGICGREFCCSTFLHQFVPVTLRMAKDQQLPLNPGKLSGLCGRLRCCLAYEHLGYRLALARLPKVGAEVAVNGRRGRVRKLDLVQEQVTVFLEEPDEYLVRSPEDLEWEAEQDLPQPRRRGTRRRRRRRAPGE